MKKRSMAVLSVAMIAGLMCVSGTPAFGTTYNGHVNCTGSPYTPDVYTYTSTGGEGNFTNYNQTNQVATFTFGSGHYHGYAPWLNTLWATSASGWHESPRATCD